jgi:Tfp pilus assembly protein PilF
MRRFIQAVFTPAAVVLLAIACVSCTAGAKRVYHLRRANRYFDAGQYDSAEIEYLNVLHVDRENHQAISRLGIIYFEQGRLGRAVPCLIMAHTLEPDNLDLRAKLGLVYLSAGKLKEARNEANFILDKKPQDAEAPLLLAETAITPTETKETRQRLETLSQQMGDSASLQVAFGILYLRQGDPQATEAALKLAKSLDPKSSAAYGALGRL